MPKLEIKKFPTSTIIGLHLSKKRQTRCQRPKKQSLLLLWPKTISQTKGSPQLMFRVLSLANLVMPKSRLKIMSANQQIRLRNRFQLLPRTSKTQEDFSIHSSRKGQMRPKWYKRPADPWTWSDQLKQHQTSANQTQSFKEPLNKKLKIQTLRSSSLTRQSWLSCSRMRLKTVQSRNLGRSALSQMKSR